MVATFVYRGTYYSVTFKRLRTQTATDKLLRSALFDLAEHFSPATSCNVCSTPVGKGQVSVVASVSDAHVLVSLAHPNCSPPKHFQTDTLMLPGSASFEYRTVHLPADSGDIEGQLPTLILRVGMDTAVFAKGDDNSSGWNLVPLVLADGFEPLSDVLSYADEKVKLEVMQNTVSVSFPGSLIVTVQDENFASKILEAGGTLVVILSKGSVDDVDTLEKLQEVLGDKTTRLALVPLSNER